MRRRETVKNTLLVLVVIALVLFCGWMEPRYEREDCVVTEVRGNEAVAEDRCGYVWCYYVEDEAPSVGDVVTLKMHTNNTVDYIDDDVVLDVVAQQ